jgi:hypothetical protein
VAHDNDPRSLGTVDAGEILSQPLVLSICSVVFVAAINSTKWPTVGNICLAFRGVGLIAREVSYEGILRAIGEVGLAIQGDKVGKTVVKGVPKVAYTASFGSWHSETVLVGRKVSDIVREKKSVMKNVIAMEGRILTSGRVDNCSK